VGTILGPDPLDASVQKKLDPTSIQRVVSRHAGSLRRACWQPALESRAPDAPKSARVSAQLVIAPNGSVSSVNTQSAERDSYPDLPLCVAREMKRWKFPRSLEGATIQLPLVFVVE
jgi:hypothetical protein